jgi:WD40 repeat protein
MKALAKDPDDRYQSVRQLALEIERYQEGFATSVEDAGFATHLRLLIGRHRREFAVGAVSLTVVVALSVWFVINLRASERRATTNAAAAITNERKAVQSEHEARLLLAAASVAEADAAFRSGDYPGMVVALERCPAGLRNSNWEYLSAKRDASIGRLQIPGFESPLAIAAVPGAQGQFALVNGKWEIGFVEVPTGKLLRTIRAERPGMRGIAFSGDGRVFANWAGKNSDLVLYETATGKKQTSIPLPNDRILEIALDQTGDLMTVITWPGDKVMSLSLVDTRTRKTRWSKEDGGFGSATFLPGGDRLSIMGFAGLARMCWLCSAEDGRDLAQRIPVYCMCQAVHPNGRIIAVGTHEGNALLIDSTNGRVVQQGKLHSGALVSLTWTSDGHLLTLGSEGKITDQRWLFRLWDPENMALRATFAGMQPTIRPDWSFNPESGYLLSRETNGTPKIWRIPAGLEKARQLHSSEQAWSAAFLSDTVLIARKDFDLARYQIPASGRKMTELTNGPSLGATYLCSNPAKGVFAIAPKVDNPSHHLRFFKQDGSSIIESASYPLGQLVRDMAFDSSASRVAITLENGSIQIVSIKSGNLHLDLPGTFQRAAFAGQDTRLLALRAQTRKSDENEFYLQLLDELGRTLETATNRFHVGAFAVSADQKLAALGGSDRSVHLFDADTLVERSVFRAHDGEIGAMAFHPSKPILATASADGSVKLWDYRNGKLLDYYLGLGGNPVVVVFSPNGQLLAVDGQERTTRVFGVSKAAELTAK